MTALTLADLRATFRRHLYLPDIAAVDFAAVVVVANRLANDPLWAVIVGASGATKTEVVESTGDVPEVYSLSTLTPATLLSAKTTNGTSAALLHRMDAAHKSFIALKDLTTILSMRSEDRNDIFGTLREVYDGAATRETGQGTTIRWTGRMGLLAGVTHAIDLKSSDLGVLGERFVYLRLPMMDDEAEEQRLAEAAMSEDNESEMRADLRTAMADFVAGVDISGLPQMDATTKAAIARMAMRSARLRTAVARDSYGSRDILMSPTPEAPTRLAKQLRQVWRGAVLVRHPNPMELVDRVATDSSGPRDRTTALRYVVARGEARASDIQTFTHLSKPATRRLLEDLQALELIEIEEMGRKATNNEPGRPTTYVATDRATRLLNVGSVPVISPSGVEGEKNSAHPRESGHARPGDWDAGVPF